MKGGSSSDVWIKGQRDRDGCGCVTTTGITEVHLLCVQIWIIVSILKAVSNLGGGTRRSAFDSQSQKTNIDFKCRRCV